MDIVQVFQVLVCFPAGGVYRSNFDLNSAEQPEDHNWLLRLFGRCGDLLPDVLRKGFESTSKGILISMGFMEGP